MSRLDFFMLGPLEVRRDDVPLEIHAPKQRALLTLLLLRANEPVPRDELIEEIWGGDVPGSAPESLRNQIHALRKILGPDAVETKARAYRVCVRDDELAVRTRDGDDLLARRL